MGPAAALAILVLSPVLDEPGPLRLVAVGTEAEPVEWWLDGVAVANTTDGVSASVQATAGEHTVTARSMARQGWSALVRSEPRTTALQPVPAWTATWEGGAPTDVASPALPAWSASVGAASAFALGWGGVRWRRSRRRQEE